MRKRRNREEEKGKQRKCGGRSTRRIGVEERKKKMFSLLCRQNIKSNTSIYICVIMFNPGVLQHIT